MTTLPTWGVLLLGLAGPIVALVALIVGRLGERGRQDHERQLQKAELGAQRHSHLREERREAYGKYISACDRLHHGDRSEEANAAFRQTLAIVWIVSSSPAVRGCVEDVGNAVLEEVEDPDSAQYAGVYEKEMMRLLEAIQQDLGTDAATIQDPA